MSSENDDRDVSEARVQCPFCSQSMQATIGRLQDHLGWHLIQSDTNKTADEWVESKRRERMNNLISEIRDLRERLGLARAAREEAQDSAEICRADVKYWRDRWESVAEIKERLREKLEEVRAEREAIERQTVPYTMYDALRRQRDRLREAVREAKSILIEAGMSRSDREAVRQARDRLSEALDHGSEGEQILRRLLWLNHGCSALYGGDGEMQCGECRIDFKRDDPQRIRDRLRDPDGREVGDG